MRWNSDGNRVCLGLDEFLDVEAGVKCIKSNSNYKDAS